ncbi:hypothetical protein ACCC97_10645 [Variovorax sp. Varisp85]|uniref:hypothetical protein n=1 Tax=Variovorax sp. Varisp85 TaxID=3243059 RepID=UPI0039A744C3
MIALDAESFSTGYVVPPAVHRRATTEGRPPLPTFGDAGTGGVETQDFYILRTGYRPFEVVVQLSLNGGRPFAKQMEAVKAGFGRTMSRLPTVFGVSRQTLYNWLDGETPKLQHREKLSALVDAAAEFKRRSFVPTSAALDRKLVRGKSFLDLLAEGANGTAVAKQLMDIETRGQSARSKLDALLGGRRARLDAADIGSPSFPEEV